MSISVLLWRSRREMSSAKRLLTNPGHCTVVVAYPDRSGKTHGTACTITWYSTGDEMHSSGSTSGGKRRGLSAASGASFGGMFGTMNRWIPKDIFREMEHLSNKASTLPTLEEWIEEHRDEGWVDIYLKNLNDPKAEERLDDLLSTRIRAPDQKVTIRSLGDVESFSGLYDANMVTWWQNFADRNNTYSLLSRSCAAVCGMALSMGGAEEWASKPAGIWTPESVFGWAKQIQKKVDAAHQTIAQARLNLKNEAAKHANPGPIWTKQQWMQASNQNVGWYGRKYGRYTLLQMIDRLLDQYEEVMRDEEVTKQFKEEAETRILSSILMSLSQILVERPSTKRRLAIGQLAAQILKRSADLEREKEQERIRIERERQELSRATALHNAPIKKRLEEIAREQLKLMRKISFGLKGAVKTPEEARKIQKQMMTLRNEQDRLQKQLL